MLADADQTSNSELNTALAEHHFADHNYFVYIAGVLGLIFGDLS